MTLTPFPTRRGETPADPIAEILVMIGVERDKQLDTFEAALFVAVAAASAISLAEVLHDARTRQLTDRAAAAFRTIALDLHSLRNPKP